MKKLILLFVCVFWGLFFSMTSKVLAQTSLGGYECGVFKKVDSGEAQLSQSDYSDRFGNKYTEEELALWNLNLQINHCDQIEDFTLIFENNLDNPFLTNEMEMICDVFDYISSIIVAPSGERAVIRLRKDPNLGAGVGAVATTFFPNQCGLGHSLVHQQLFTGGVNTPQHGLIAINANISNFYIGPAAGIGLNQVDYYTVILHEALHVLGFGSQITPSGAPSQGFYTMWDLNLVNNNGDNMIISTMPSTNGSCCTGYGFNSADFLGMPNLIWNQNCTPTNVKFDVAQLPPVNGEYSGQDAQTFMNVLSHLDRTCGSEHYVMNSSIPSGTNGVQRTLTNAETAILCRLGYQASGCTPDCMVIAENDGTYFVAQGLSIPIDISELLANDFPNNATFSLMTNCGNSGGIGVTSTGNQIVIQGNDLGVYTFCYSITGCNGLRCDVATVRIVVTNPALAEACENLEDCQINPFEDFEHFGSSEELQQVLTAGEGNDAFGFGTLNPNGFWDNTPDLVPSGSGYWGIPPCNVPYIQAFTPSGDQMVRFVTRFGHPEGISLPLCEPIFPGMSGTVTFIATSSDRCQVLGPQVRVEFSENAPVTGELVYENPGISSPSWFVPITSTVSTTPSFITYTVQFTNQSEVCWNFLYLSSFTEIQPNMGAAAIFIDLVHVNINNNLLDILEITSELSTEEPCLGEQIEMRVEICNTIECNGNTFSNPETLVTAQLPPGLTLIPNADFPSLTHLINEGDIPPGGCIELTLTVQVSDDIAYDGQALPINLQFSPLDPCFDGVLFNAGQVKPMNCSVPGFTCPCTGPDALNIDAGDPSTNPNDPNAVLTSISATVIPTSTVNTFLGKALIRPCIAIKGNLIIDGNSNLVIGGGEIRMQPGAKIIIAPGSSLFLLGVNGGTGTTQGIHGCDQMWRGIQVAPGGSLYSAFNVIQDAEYAFDLRSSSLSAATNLSSYGNIFDRNHVGIRVNNNLTAAINQPYQFAKNQFRATSTLLPRFSDDITNWLPNFPYSGMSLKNTTFMVGTLNDPSSDNEFNGLRNGIQAFRTTLDVHHARFLNTQGIVQTSPNFSNSQGIGIFAHVCPRFNLQNCLFENAPRGIHTRWSNLDIRNSTLRHVDDAIYNLPWLSNKINVYDNDIFFRRNGVVVDGGGISTRVTIDRNHNIETEPSAFVPYAISLRNMPSTSVQTKRVANNQINLHQQQGYGIHIDAAGGWIVQENIIEYTNPGGGIEAGIRLSDADNNLLKENEIRSTFAASSNDKVGIDLFNSENNTLCCNITDELRSGLRFIGMNDDSRIRHSDLRNHQIGIECGYPIITPGQPLPIAIIGDQVLAGNHWNGSYSLHSAVHYGDEPSVLGSQFRSELPQVLPLWPNNPISPATPNQWFLPNLQGGSSTTCFLDALNCPILPPPPYAPEEPRDLTNNEKVFANGQYAGLGAYGLAAQFEGERSLYSKMKHNTSLSGQNGLVDQFFGAAATSHIGQLYLIDSLINDLGQISEENWKKLNELEESVDIVISEIHRIDSLYAFAENLIDTLQLQEQKLELTNQFQPLQEEWQSITDELNAQQLAKASIVASLNNGIISNNLPASNRKIVNRIFLETHGMGNYTATEAQLNDLFAVASQCFLEGGDAVLQARALYNTFAPALEINDMKICGNQTEERSRNGIDNSVNLELKVVPNPAKDRISFLIPGVLPDATIYIQVFDLNGKVVKELKVNNGEMLAHKFAPGLYLCRAQVEGEPTQTIKFIIFP